MFKLLKLYSLSEISGRAKKTEILGCELQKAIEGVNTVADYYHDQYESQKVCDEKIVNYYLL